MIAQTKKNEVVRTISRYEDLALTVGNFLNKAVCKEWVEDFVDEDSGEVVPIPRKEVIYDKGTEITNELVSSLLFYLQTGDIKEVEISNQRRSAYESVYGTRIYLAVAEIGPKHKKYKFLFSANSIPVSVDILKDYIELNFQGGYRIISIKEFQTSLILDDDLKKDGVGNEDDELLNKEKFYQITAIVIAEDGFENSTNAVVKTIDLDKALMLLNRKLVKHVEGEFTLKLEEAKLLTVDCIIEDEFTMAYKENGNE